MLQIGKTATSAVAEGLRPHILRGSYWIRLHTHETPLTDVPQGDSFVFGIRDPIQRFVSGFNSRKRQGRPRFDAPWTKFEREAFRRFRTPNELAEQIEVDEAAQEAMRRINHVRSSYWDWFIDEEYFLSRRDDLVLVLRQSHLAKDFARLARLLGVPGDLPQERVHANPTSMDHTLSPAARGNLRTWYRRDYDFLELLGTLGLPTCDGQWDSNPPR